MKANLKQHLFMVFALSSLIVVLLFILYTVAHSKFWDFQVFYYSGQTALQGNNIYRPYGAEHLPFWYFPWVSWLFIPLAIFPFETARIFYLFVTFLSIPFIVWSIGRYFNEDVSLASQVLIVAMSTLMCWLLFRAGQVDFILAALVTATILLIEKKRNFQAGLLFPILLFKPHLLTIFILFALLRGGKKFIFSATLSVLLLSLVAFFLIPNWPLEIVRMLDASGQRTDNNWGFTTFAAWVGREENWSGTANLPITIILMLVAFWAVWKNRHLPTVPLLAFSLSASLLCAPRAYSYNFPFLIPALLWLSPEKMSLSSLMWIGLGIFSYVTRFSTGSYAIVMVVFALGLYKAYKLTAPQTELNNT